MHLKLTRLILLIPLLLSGCSSSSTSKKSTILEETTATTTIDTEVPDQLLQSPTSSTANTSASNTVQPDIQSIKTDISNDEGIELENPLRNTFGDYSIDRDHPFQSIDKFCVAYSPIKEEKIDAIIKVKSGDSIAKIAAEYDLTIEELLDMNDLANPNIIFIGQEIRIGKELTTGLGPQVTGKGISEESVSVVHVRNRTEELEFVGFNNFNLDTTEIFESFVKIINDECGGFHGRSLRLEEVEVSAFDAFGVSIESLSTAACLAASQEIPSVIVFDPLGLSGPLADCVTNLNKTALITSKSISEKLLEESNKRIILDSFTTEEAFSLMINFAELSGLLVEKSIAIVADNNRSNYQSIISVLREGLQKLGYNPDFYVIDCENGIFCTEGTSSIMEALLQDPPDILFPTLNVFSLPEFIFKMVENGIPKPQIIQSGFNFQDMEIATRHLLDYGGMEIAEYYDGTIIVSHRPENIHLTNDYEPSSFDKMCLLEYSRASNIDQHLYDSRAKEIVVRICSHLRYAARAIYDSGLNPSRRTIHESFSNLGQVDSPGMIPGSFKPGKLTRPDTIRSMRYNYPCEYENLTPENLGEGCIMSDTAEQNLLIFKAEFHNKDL